MFPEDRVLVGVIKRKRDLQTARSEHWYRIPQNNMPRGFHAEYVAFFLSRAFGSQNGGIHYHARVRGIELAYRKDLLPDEAQHPRSQERYFKVQLDEVQIKTPPVLNTTKRSISFIFTTWDRYVSAREIRDLYSQNDYFVDRVYHALRSSGIRPERVWEAERQPAELRILCQNGTVVASTQAQQGALYLRFDEDEPDEILQKILANIAAQGGPVMLNIPLEGI